MSKSLDMRSLQRALETWRQGNFQERRIPEDPVVIEIDSETFAVRVSHESEKLQLREEFILCAPDGHVYAVTHELMDKLRERLRVYRSNWIQQI
jgi:hypothetical protein